MGTVLSAQVGRATGSAASRRLRAEDRIPGVLYGHGMSPLSVAVERRELRVALSGAAGVNTVLDLTVDGTVYPAIVKELQRHPVRRNVVHVDFIQVNLDEEITVAVPLRLEGAAMAVEQEGGLVDPAVDSIEVVTTPRNIPAEFVIDVSAMTMDTVIRLADVPMPAGVTATGDPESPVVTVLTMRAEVAEIEAADAEVAAEQEAEAAEEAAEEAPAEGEGAAEGEAEAAEGGGEPAEGGADQSGE
jgi:large subunit ribosomal protein L25